MKIISLGWGVQSWTMAAMVALGDLPPVDFAIHADTGHELQGTYEFARIWEPWLLERGVEVATVKNENPILHSMKSGKVYTDIPVYTQIKDKSGQIRRQCTNHWKIVPMRQKISEKLRLRGLPKSPGIVEQWIGISKDEWKRMKDSDVQYIRNVWPLIDLGFTRNDCIDWLRFHGLGIPPKSACTFCPFHSTQEWRNIKNNPTDWAEAVLVDRDIRKARPPFDLYVHPSRKPLEDIDFRTEQEKGQLELWDEECSGICGV